MKKIFSLNPRDFIRYFTGTPINSLTHSCMDKIGEMHNNKMLKSDNVNHNYNSNPPNNYRVEKVDL